MTDIANQPLTTKSTELFNNFLLKNKDPYIPRDTRQIYNKQQYEKNKSKQSKHTTTHYNNKNVADNMQEWFNKIHTHPYIQGICGLKGSTPSVILYTDEQIKDLDRFCFSSDTAKTTVIGIDRTFNLTNFHLTTTIYKNLPVLRRSTNEHPIFLVRCTSMEILQHAISIYFLAIYLLSFQVVHRAPPPLQPLFVLTRNYLFKIR